MEQSDADRAAVAREVLTELLEFAYARAETVSDTRQFMRERYPAPPAPETVTVGSATWTRDEDGWWVHQSDTTRDVCAPQSTIGTMCDRIASDARVIQERDARIAELETQLQRALDGAVFHEKRAHHAEQERDAALRALREYQNGIGPMGSKGEGCGEVGVSTAAHGGSGVTQPESSNSGESSVAAPSSAAPSPAPRRWLVVALRDGRAMYIYEDNKIGAQLAEAAAQPEGRSVVPVVEAVATRETVERVVTILRKQAWSSVPFTHRAEEILTAAGITLEEGA